MTGALVLAGRSNAGLLAPVSNAPLEALIEVAGRPMIAYVLEALAGCRAVERIVVVGDEGRLAPAVAGVPARFVAPGQSLVESLRIGIEALAGAERILVLTSDIPLITAEALDDFVLRAEGLDARFFYAVVERSRYEAAFPGSRRTYVRLRDGVFTGGNVFLADAGVARGAVDLVERFYAHRKSPLALARLLGFGTILAFALGRLRVADLERRVSDMVGAPGRAIISRYPEIGFDVDRPEDLAAAETYLRRRQKGGAG